MMYQAELLFLSAILVIVLTILLITRIRQERKTLQTLRRMAPADFSDFLRSNSVEGTIQVVAGRVSGFLKNVFGCEKIIFLRKQRGHLELNYYHGIRAFNRAEFRCRFSRQLVPRLQQSSLPRPVDELADLLSDSCLARLRKDSMDTFFPVFWRDNLYGIYFIKSNMETESTPFKLLISGLAHSLAAAYHIKWHESRFERLQSRASEMAAQSSEANKEQRAPKQIIKLVRHRNSESIVPRIAESVQENLGLSRVVLLYEPRQKGGPLILWKNGINRVIDTPGQADFDQLQQSLSQADFKPIDALIDKGMSSGDLPQQLKDAGLTHLTRLPLTSRRSAVMAWSGGGSPQAMARDLTVIRSQTRDLVENAESYERVEELSYTDALTGLANQRYFHKRLTEEIDRARRYERSMALIIFDLDDLKTVNDNFGHLAGDAVLKRLGQILRASIRAIDIIARYGGDEFCVIMPEADGATCERFMRRLQEKISSSGFSVSESQQELHQTISQGGAVFPIHGDSSENLMKAADSALLKAKGAGRNKHLLYGPELEV